MIANWDDVAADTVGTGHIASTWRDLGMAAGSQRVGVNRIQVEPNKWSGPVHRELDAEEIFFVLAGSGVSFQNDEAYDVRAGDCIVHRVADVHGLRAGDDGIDVLAFGERMDARYTHFPRVNVIGNYPGVTVEVSSGPRAWDREISLGAPELPPLSENPTHIANPVTVEADYEGDRGRWVRMAHRAGAVRTGLNWGFLAAGCGGAPPHCHSAEEELFVVLEGTGTLELWPSPQAARAEAISERERHPLRAGDVVSRPSGTRVGHYFIAGDEGMTFLSYGEKNPNDICYYPRSNKIFWRGVGLIARLESLDYDDGEPEE